MHCEPDLFVRERFKLFFQFMNFLFECRDTVFSNIGTHTFTLCIYTFFFSSFLSPFFPFSFKLFKKCHILCPPFDVIAGLPNLVL